MQEGDPQKKKVSVEVPRDIWEPMERRAAELYGERNDEGDPIHGKTSEVWREAARYYLRLNAANVTELSAENKQLVDDVRRLAATGMVDEARALREIAAGLSHQDRLPSEIRSALADAVRVAEAVLKLRA
jgi:hypothetical protein